MTSQQYQYACAVLFHPAVRFCRRDFILLVVLTPLYTIVIHIIQRVAERVDSVMFIYLQISNSVCSGDGCNVFSKVCSLGFKV